MDMLNSVSPLRVMLVAVPVLSLGLSGVFWSVVALPSFWQTAPAHDLSRRIVANDRFNPVVLADMMVRMDVADRTMMQPEFLSAKALIKLRAVEEATQRKSAEEAEREAKATEDTLRFSLAMNPTDSLLWMMLYSISIAHRGLDLGNISYLERSYVQGPNEGWIALQRNRLTLAIFPLLDEATQRYAISEFAALVDGGFIAEAATNFTRQGPVEQQLLLKGLERSNIGMRRIFARELWRDGVKVFVPGVELDERFWR